MQRIALTPTDGTERTTWFDADRAARYVEDTWWDGSNWVSHATGSQYEHEAVFHTATGRWVLNHWSQWAGHPETYYEIEEAQAVDWLLQNHYSEVVEALDADVLAAREVGAGTTPQRTIRLADDLWQAAQDRARAEGTDASGLIRRLLAEYVAQSLT